MGLNLGGIIGGALKGVTGSNPLMAMAGGLLKGGFPPDLSKLFTPQNLLNLATSAAPLLGGPFAPAISIGLKAVQSFSQGGKFDFGSILQSGLLDKLGPMGKLLAQLVAQGGANGANAQNMLDNPLLKALLGIQQPEQTEEPVTA